MPGYSKEQLAQLYKDLPKDLQEAVFSEENSYNLREICLKNGVRDEDVIFEITKNLGYVFLGLLVPNELQDVLEKELKIEKSKAEQITSEISRFIFLPVKNSLETLYNIKIKAGLKPKITHLSPKTARKRTLKTKDRYREFIE